VPPDRSAPAAERRPLIFRRLRKAYPEARIALRFTNPLECVVATVLSAQSTDARVNLVTRSLFEKYRRPEDYLSRPEDELKADIQSTGFFNQKAKALRGISQKLIDDFDGEVPTTIAELTTLPGVARKTANVVQSACWPEMVRKDPDAGIAVDTHVGRVSVRLGFTSAGPKDADKVEGDLMALVPKKDWSATTHLFIEHGRAICEAKRPRCENCVIEPLCPSSQEAGLPDLYRVALLGKRPRARATPNP
jgi:endonuclease-3